MAGFKHEKSYEEWRELRLNYKNSDYFIKAIRERRNEWEELKDLTQKGDYLYDDYYLAVQRWMTNMDNLYNCFDCPNNDFILESILKEKINRNIENCNHCIVLDEIELIKNQRKEEIKINERIIEEDW